MFTCLTCSLFSNVVSQTTLKISNIKSGHYKNILSFYQKSDKGVETFSILCRAAQCKCYLSLFTIYT